MSNSLISRFLSVFLVLLFFIPKEGIAQGNLPTPESYFGFKMGADRKLAHWDDLVKYYDLLGVNSDRMKVVHMGETTLGNPFLALYISSPENLANLEEYREINAMLTDPRGVSASKIEAGILKGKAVVVQSFGLHSSEVAASQTAAEFTYDMLSRNDEEMQRILDNTISIIIPCFNPDGEIMITEWYNKYIGTEYEGSSMPYLYHHYIGHDNNRDAYMQNTVESSYGAQIIFKDFVPQAYVDHHQMGAYGARLYVPPYSEPIRPDADPLVWREMAWYGAHIAYKEEEADKAGVVNAAVYSGWGHFGFHWITPFHNIAGMLTESASAQLATPLFVHPDQLEGWSRGLPKYEEQTSFPNPWKGGWWHVRDIVEQQKIAAMAIVDIAARNRETVLRTAYLKAKRQSERGEVSDVKAYIIGKDQHDGGTADKLVEVLLNQGVEVRQSASEFTHEGKVYGAGTRVVTMAQPKRGVIRWLLGQTNYPDNDYTRFRDGTPIRPYDMSTDNIAEYFGVAADPVSTKVDASSFRRLETLDSYSSRVDKGSKGYVLDGKLNDSFTAANLLMNEKVKLKRVTKSGNGLNAGDFIVPSNAKVNVLNAVSQQTGVAFAALEADAVSSEDMKRQRIGLFQRYLGGNMDEGWTRLLLENFEFPYTTIMDKAVLGGDLSKNFDVIVLPDDGVAAMTGKGLSGRYAAAIASMPEEYRSGFGQAGIDALKAFVEAGGTIVTFGGAGEMAIKEFKVPVTNVVERTSSTEFWSPGSTLKVNIDNSNPIAFGMPEKGLVLFTGGNDVYSINRTTKNQDVQRIATYASRDIMASGWLLGEEVIANKAAIVSVKMGVGQVVMIGFRPQHRVQTHGTFKFVFNALVGD
jgi:hypothetical protein